MLFWSRFGRVLERVLGGFRVLLEGFQGFQDESKFWFEVETRKSGSRVMKGGVRGVG